MASEYKLLHLQMPGFETSRVVLRWLPLVSMQFVLLAGCSPSDSSSAAPQMAQLAAQQAEKIRAEATEGCQRTILKRSEDFHAHTKAGRLWQAVDAIGSCARLLNNTALQAEVDAVQIRAHRLAVQTTKAPAHERLRSLEAFERNFPDAAAAYANLKPELERLAAVESAKRAAIEAKAEAARKRKAGVHIGASEEDALASAWGKPNKINRTIRAGLVSEQWVYENGYLYFENGILTAIQN